MLQPPPPTPELNPHICENPACRASLEIDTKFCMHCGTPVQDSNGTPMPPPLPQTQAKVQPVASVPPPIPREASMPAAPVIPAMPSAIPSNLSVLQLNTLVPSGPFNITTGHTPEQLPQLLKILVDGFVRDRYTIVSSGVQGGQGNLIVKTKSSMPNFLGQTGKGRVRITSNERGTMLDLEQGPQTGRIIAAVLIAIIGVTFWFLWILLIPLSLGLYRTSNVRTAMQATIRRTLN